MSEVKLTERTSHNLRRLDGLGFEMKLSFKPGGGLSGTAIACREMEDFFRIPHDSYGWGPSASKVFPGTQFYGMKPGLAMPPAMTLDPTVPALRGTPSGMTQVNCSLFRAVGISKGLSFKLNWPLNDTEFEQYCKGVQRQYVEFFRMHLMPREMTVRVDLTEV